VNRNCSPSQIPISSDSPGNVVRVKLNSSEARHIFLLMWTKMDAPSSMGTYAESSYGCTVVLPTSSRESVEFVIYEQATHFRRRKDSSRKHQHQRQTQTVPSPVKSKKQLRNLRPQLRL
jgi:hypothetical protein